MQTLEKDVIENKQKRELVKPNVPTSVTFIVEDASGYEAVGTTSKFAITIKLTDMQFWELAKVMEPKAGVLDCYPTYDFTK